MSGGGSALVSGGGSALDSGGGSALGSGGHLLGLWRGLLGLWRGLLGLWRAQPGLWRRVCPGLWQASGGVCPGSLLSFPLSCRIFSGTVMRCDTISCISLSASPLCWNWSPRSANPGQSLVLRDLHQLQPRLHGATPSRGSPGPTDSPPANLLSPLCPTHPSAGSLGMPPTPLGWQPQDASRHCC